MDGVILAGGKSKRIGKDKAFIRIHGNLLVEIVFFRLKAMFDKIIVVANRSNFPMLVSLFHLWIHRDKVEVVTDVVPEKGPLGGIYTGLKASQAENIFVIACDMPFLNKKLIGYMVKLGKTGQYDIVVPRTHLGFEPLHAIYSKSVIPVIENQLRNNQLKVSHILERVRTRFVDEDEIRRFDPKLLFLKNLNTRHDIKSVAVRSKLS